VATDGILCYIVQGYETSSPKLFLGHLAHFVPDDVEISVDSIRKATAQGAKPMKDEELERLLQEYV
jgi:aspartyl/asparaginyl beta-hydroxylase (cupin superfamily)